MLSVESRRRDFPSLEGQAYLNTAAENIPPQRVFDAVNAYMRDKCDGMNGRKAHFERVHACRSVAARMIGLAPEEVSFCSCSSEAYNLLTNAIDPQKFSCSMWFSGSPPTKICPDDGRMTRASMFSRVDLPLPTPPTTPK